MLAHYASPKEEEVIDYYKNELISLKKESLRQRINITENVMDIRQMAEKGELSPEDALSVIGKFPYFLYILQSRHIQRSLFTAAHWSCGQSGHIKSQKILSSALNVIVSSYDLR